LLSAWSSMIEKRPGFAGTLRTLGGCGPFRGPHVNRSGLGAMLEPAIEERHGFAATFRTLGGCGPFRGPHVTRSVLGAMLEPEIEERHGFAGTFRTLGGLGAISGPPSPNGPEMRMISFSDQVPRRITTTKRSPAMPARRVASLTGAKASVRGASP